MRKVKFRKSFATMLITIFLVFNILSIVIFTYYATYIENSKTEEYAKKAMNEIVKEKSDMISLNLNRIESYATSYGSWMETLLASNIDLNYKEYNKNYTRNKDGSIVRKEDSKKNKNSYSSIIVEQNEETMVALEKEILITQKLDKPFEIVLSGGDIQWAYIVTENNLLRCSPYSNMDKRFATGHNQREDIFYTIANKKNNPKRKTVWTKPYNDYLGTGWTMTCSQPIYRENGNMYGVLSLDVSINELKRKYFDGFSVGKTGLVYWLNKEGDVYYYTNFDEESKNQGEAFEKNIFEDADISSEKSNALKKILRGDTGMLTIIENGAARTLVSAKVEGTDSTIIVDMDNNEFTATTAIDTTRAGMIVLIDLILAVIFSIVLYYWFSKPMKQLVEQANEISQGDYSTIEKDKIYSSNVYEISQLTGAFSTMNESIKEYTEMLLNKNKQINIILDTISGTLMIVDSNGKPYIVSKETDGVTKQGIENALKIVCAEKVIYKENIVINGDAYENTYYPIKRDDGTVDSVVISSECITEKVLIEKEMQQIEKMAGVGQLAAAIVHEMKNSLALIKGANYILKITNKNGENDKEIDTIMKAVNDAENVITTLLDFSGRDERGGELIHIGTLINQILLLSKKETIQKNINFNLNLNDDCYIYSSEREAIKVVLQNLIINAIQAVEDDGEISITCETKNKNAIIMISDNGVGINEAVMKDIFKPFISTKRDGNGIGLWITKRLVKVLNGTIEVKSEEGVGTECSGQAFL